MHRSVLMAQGDEIGVDASSPRDGDGSITPKTVPAVAHATFAAEQSRERWSAYGSRRRAATSSWRP